MNRERGQGLVEYALILVLVGIVIVVMLAIIGPIFQKATNPPQPPAMDAPLLDIVRWCESNARDTISSTTTSYNVTTKRIETKPTSRQVDSPEKFIACMQSYEYIVKR